MYFLSRCSVLETPKKPVSAVIAVIVRQGFSRPSVPPNGSHKCLRFGLWPTLTHSLTATRNRLWVVAPSMLTGRQR